MIRAIVFDLDDTLLLTSEVLIPRAIAESCAAMVDAGLDCTVEECIETREQIMAAQGSTDVFGLLANFFGARDQALEPRQLADVGRHAFYHREIKEDLVPAPGVHELLATLSKQYALFLVTAGGMKTQQQKVDKLAVSHHFRQIFIVDVKTLSAKLGPYRTIQEITGYSPDAHLSVGNRIETDLIPAKSLGWKTCWLKKGEYSHRGPGRALERPDFEILDIRDLITECGL